MDEIDLTEYEWNLIVRDLTLDDHAAIVQLQAMCFPGMNGWTIEQFESQLTIFPEGQIGIECDGKLVASSSCLILRYEEQMEWHNYRKLSDNGFIRNHVPDGDTLYGIEIMVNPEFRAEGVVPSEEFGTDHHRWPHPRLRPARRQDVGSRICGTGDGQVVL